MGKKRRTNKSGQHPKTDWEFIHRILHSPAIRTVYIYGPPGIGKTYSAYHEGRDPAGVFAVTLTEDTPAAELRGHFIPAGKEMIWHDGPFTSAMRKGARLVINELTHAPPEVVSLLYPVLESIETARLTLPTNETVWPASGFQVICTDNEPPDQLPDAIRDRFDAIVEISEPHPEALDLLAEPLREAARRSHTLEDERRVSVRGWHAVQRLQDEFGLRDACCVVFGPNRGGQIYDVLILGGNNGDNK